MVKEFTNPLKEPIDDDINLFDFLDRRAQRDPDGSTVEYKADGGWKSFSATQFRDLVIALGKGLIGLGVKKGDAVSIVSRTRWEWTALDMAIMAVGALTVPVYETNSDAQVSWIFNDSQATIAFAEDDGQRDKIESIHDEVQSLRKVFVIEAGALEALQAYGKEVSDEEFWARKNDAHGDDLATIVYTSGSTGTPKGVELSHRNLAFLCLSAMQYMPRACAWPDRRLLLFLPLSHVFARFMELLSFCGTLTLGLSSDMKTIVARSSPWASFLRAQNSSSLTSLPYACKASSAPARASPARCSCVRRTWRGIGRRPSRPARNCRGEGASPTGSTSWWCTRRSARFSARTPTSPSPAAPRWMPTFRTSSTASACRCLRATA